MTELRNDLADNPPLPGAYTPKKGDLCAAKFSDDLWYRARVTKVQSSPPRTPTPSSIFQY